jgi:hypothetical protein
MVPGGDDTSYQEIWVVPSRDLVKMSEFFTNKQERSIPTVLGFSS